ncbi:MAG: hypothetical protein HOC74_15130 [Gemmatimonadetes bacterium]|jgi:hypothetical protein|nr:hypothetical protein [Gemmatimonadota bacterium]
MGNNPFNTPPLEAIQERYEKALLQGDSGLVHDCIQDALGQKLHPQQIYLEVLLPTVCRIRRKGREGSLDPLFEEYAITLSLEQTHLLRDVHPIGADLRRHVAVLVLEKGLGRFEGYLAADLLRMDGWKVDYFSKPVAIDSLASFWQHRPIDLLVFLGKEPVDWMNLQARRQAIPAEITWPACLVVGVQEMPFYMTQDGKTSWKVCSGLQQLLTAARETIGGKGENKGPSPWA